MSDSDSERKRDQKKRRRREAKDDASSERSYRQKKKKHRHKDRKKKSKKKLKDRKHSSRTRSESPAQHKEEVCLRPNSECLPTNDKDNGIGPPEEIQQHEQLRKQEQAHRMAPMSREEYQAQQSTIREVYDEQTGRYRLVRGTGEIIESLVSRSQHETINQQATRGDGASFSRDIFRAAQR